MVVADTLVYHVTPSGFWGYKGSASPASLGLSNDRVQRYQELLASLRIRRVEIHPSSAEGDEHPYPVEVRGRTKVTFRGRSCASIFSHNTWEKGHSYLTDYRVVQDTDKVDSARVWVAARRIAGDWYVYHWYKK